MVYIVDPYHIFHETRWNKNLWFGSQTLINLGQIETYLKRSNDYDGILVGSSYSMNFKGSDLAKAVGAKGVLKLCNGNQSLEMGLMWQRKGLATGKVKHCFVEIDALRFLRSSDIDSSLEAAKPYINLPYLCLFNLKNLSSLVAFYCILHKFVPQNDNRFWTWTNLDEVFNWFLYKRKDFKYWIYPDLKKKIVSARSYRNNHQAVSNQPIAIMRANPLVKFYVFLPAVSLAWNIEYYNYCLTWNRHFITACADLPNVKIYGWHDCAFVSNLANYYDPGHYHPDINRYMAWCIEHDKHRLTKENYDAYEARCVENLRAFKILDSYPHRDTFDELVAAEMQDGN